MWPAFGSLVNSFVLAGMLFASDGTERQQELSAHQLFSLGLPNAFAIQREPSTGVLVPARHVVAGNVWELFRKAYPSGITLADLSSDDLKRYFDDLIITGSATLNSGIGASVESEIVALHAAVASQLANRGLLTQKRFREIEGNLALAREIGAIVALRSQHPSPLGSAGKPLDIENATGVPVRNGVWFRSGADGSPSLTSYALDPNRISLIMLEGCRFAADAISEIVRTNPKILRRLDVLLLPGPSFNFPYLQKMADQHSGMKIYMINRNEFFDIVADTRISPIFVHGATGEKLYGWSDYESFADWIDDQESKRELLPASN